MFANMKRWILLLPVFFSVLTLKAQTYEYGKLCCADGDTLLYRYLTPEKTDTLERYPLVLYLHTSGERGSDNEGTVFGAQMFLNPVNRKIFDHFDRAIDEGRIPDDQLFVSNEDESVSQLAADLLSSPYKLDQWEKHGIFVKREEDVLRATVLSSIYRYKDLIIEDRRKAVEEELKTTEDPDDQLILLKQKKDLDDIRKQLNKELGIVIAK